MNLLSGAVAPLSVGGRFFSEILVTGSHASSLKAVADGAADVAAIDAVTPKKEMWGKVSDALIAMGLVTSWLSDEIYDGEDPSKVDLAVSRAFGARAHAKAKSSKMRSDVDRRFRLGSNPAHAPRFDDPRFYDRWVGGLQAIGAPEVFERIGDMGRHAGAPRSARASPSGARHRPASRCRIPTRRRGRGLSPATARDRRR